MGRFIAERVCLCGSHSQRHSRSLALLGVDRRANGGLKHFQLQNGLDVFVKEDHARKVAAIQLWVIGRERLTRPTQETRDKPCHRTYGFQRDSEKGRKRRAGLHKRLKKSAGNQCLHQLGRNGVPHRGAFIGNISEHGHCDRRCLQTGIDPNELKKEKQVVLEEILEEKDRPEDVASEMLFKTAYIKSPYRFPVIGQKDIVEKITRRNIWISARSGSPRKHVFAGRRRRGS